MKLSRITSTAAILLLASSAVLAQTVDVKDAWVRVTVPGQQGTGAFMKLTAREALTLTGASTPVAAVAEVHEMKMQGDVMTMRAVPALDLASGQTVELRPGSYHLMLMDLKKPLPKGSMVPLTLTFKDVKGVPSKVTVQVPVDSSAPAASGAAPAQAHKHSH